MASVTKFADPVSGETLGMELHCPECASDLIEYWGGRKLGVVRIPTVSYYAFTALDRAVALRKIQEFVDSWNP